MYIIRILLTLILCLTFRAFHAPDCSSAQTVESGATALASVASKRILVLYSYGYSLPAQQQIANGFNAEIARKKLSPDNIFHEYLDINPPRSKDQKELLRKTLLSKYAGQHFDLIITIFDTALDFITNEGADISPGSPVVAFITRERKNLERGDQKIKFIQFQYDLKGTLELALKLFPKTKRVVFMAGKTKSNVELEEQARIDFLPWKGKLEFEHTSHLAVEEMLQRVNHLPPDTIVIFSIVTSDITGRIFIPKELLTSFARESNAPFFGIVTPHIGTGVIGGSMYSMEAAGAMLGQATINVLDNKKIDIEPLSALVKPVFDWKQIERWKCNISSLPQNSQFLNRPLTLWGQYKEFVLTSAMVILLLSALALALTLQVRRRLLAEKELRESEQHFRTIFDASNEGMIIHELPSFRMTDVNSTMCEMFGYTREEVLALSLGDLSSGIPPYTRERISKVLTTAASGTPQLTEWQARHKSGRLFWIEAQNKTIRLGHHDRVVASIRDITEKKRLEEQLILSQKMESIGRLAGGVAHDFNNMLSVIMGYTEMAKLHIADQERVEQDLDEILSAAERSRNITRQLLAFSRKEIISPKPVDLNRHIADSEKNLSRLIGEDIQLSFHPAKDLWTIKIDPSQLDQILINLLVNARDAMPKGGIIQVETANSALTQEYCLMNLDARPGRYVQLSVTDTGHGMNLEIVEHIFEPFFTTKDVGKGTGLGLSTVYGIVTQNHGFINVYSEVGSGTVFKVYIPTTEEVSGEKPNEPLICQTGTGNVLLVEDDNMVRGMATYMLENMGYTVVQAETPHEAIEIYRREMNSIDIILTDVVMPGMNGKEMTDRLKEYHPDIKVLYMSGYTSDLVAQRGIVEEGMHFIQKPFDIHTLNTRLKEAIG